MLIRGTHTERAGKRLCFWRIFDKNIGDRFLFRRVFYKEHSRSVVADKVSYFWVIFRREVTLIYKKTVLCFSTLVEENFQVVAKHFN